MPIENVLKRCFPSLVLVLIAAAAFFQAHGATQLLSLALGDNIHFAKARRGATPESTAKPKSARAILERNPFDSVTGPFTNDPALSLGSLPRSNSVFDPLSSPTCEGIQVLIVTESRDPWWSLASLRVPSEPRARLRRVGDGIAGKRVAFIGFNPKQQTPAVWMEGNGLVCQSALFREQPVIAEAPTANAASGVQRLNDTELNVEHSLVERSLQDPTSVMGMVRVVPERKDGKLLGLRLFGIRPGSLLNAIGLQNGDRLESINGFDIASPEKALEAYARLATAKRLNVRLNRVGRPLEINLNIS